MDFYDTDLKDVNNKIKYWKSDQKRLKTFKNSGEQILP